MEEYKSVNQVSYTITLLAILVIGNLAVMMLFDNDLPYILIPFVLVLLVASAVSLRRRTGKTQNDERVESITDKSSRNAFLAALVIFYAIAFEIDAESAKLILGGITATMLVFAISILVHSKKGNV